MKKKSLYFSLLICLLLSVNSTLFATESNTIKNITAFHNNLRATYSLSPLQWSEKLSSYAEQWVNHLAKTKNCAMVHRPNYGDSSFKQIHGENLFWASPEVFSDGEVIMQDIDTNHVFQAWAEEENFYDYQTNTCLPGKDCGHYTQIIWHETKKVGCAMAICPDKSQIWACNYSPRGNYIGEWPY